MGHDCGKGGVPASSNGGGRVVACRSRMLQRRGQANEGGVGCSLTSCWVVHGHQQSFPQYEGGRNSNGAESSTGRHVRGRRASHCMAWQQTLAASTPDRFSLIVEDKHSGRGQSSFRFSHACIILASSPEIACCCEARDGLLFHYVGSYRRSDAFILTGLHAKLRPSIGPPTTLHCLVTYFG